MTLTAVLSFLKKCFIDIITVFFKISLIQSILCKSSFNLLLLKKFLLYTLNLGGGFGVMKSSRITNLIKWSKIECVILPDKVVDLKKKYFWLEILICQ